ncbi:MAG: transposase [Wolbachia endosymbiont of Ephestia elutella]|uniref:Transposase n=1 Tax=Wolbachia endosymbiont of Ephestia elutella TaxID=3231696 RepID=A0AAU8MJE3_9RICK
MNIFCGVLYALKSGYQWRMLPKEFPKTAQLLLLFQKWSEKVKGNKKKYFGVHVKKNS